MLLFILYFYFYYFFHLISIFHFSFYFSLFTSLFLSFFRPFLPSSFLIFTSTFSYKNSGVIKLLRSRYHYNHLLPPHIYYTRKLEPRPHSTPTTHSFPPQYYFKKCAITYLYFLGSAVTAARTDLTGILNSCCAEDKKRLSSSFG